MRLSLLYRIARGLPVLLLVTLVLLGASSRIHADVPRSSDIVACNDEAQETARKGNDSRGASPTAKDHSRAADARRGDPSAAAPRATEPQLDGMDSDGAKDPAYQAAYRTCMRKAGF